MKLIFRFAYLITGLCKPSSEVIHATTKTTDMRVQRHRRLRSPRDPRGLLPVTPLAAFVRQPQREVEGRVLDRRAARLEARPRRHGERLTRRGCCAAPIWRFAPNTTLKSLFDLLKIE